MELIQSGSWQLVFFVSEEPWGMFFQVYCVVPSLCNIWAIYNKLVGKQFMTFSQRCCQQSPEYYLRLLACVYHYHFLTHHSLHNITGVGWFSWNQQAISKFLTGCVHLSVLFLWLWFSLAGVSMPLQLRYLFSEFGVHHVPVEHHYHIFQTSYIQYLGMN